MQGRGLRKFRLIHTAAGHVIVTLSYRHASVGEDELEVAVHVQSSLGARAHQPIIISSSAQSLQAEGVRRGPRQGVAHQAHGHTGAGGQTDE